MEMAGRATSFTMEDLLAYKVYIAASEGSEKRGLWKKGAPSGKEHILEEYRFFILDYTSDLTCGKPLFSLLSGK
jgi:hypothetical protein